MHGLFGSARNWAAVARRLSASHRVISVDLPNHGESPSATHLTYQSMAEAVAELMARETPRGAALLGHSMGGKVAMTLALTRADLVTRLIVADIAPVPYGHQDENDSIIDALLGLPLAQIRSRAQADTALAEKIGDPLLRSFLLANLIRDGDGFAWKIDLAALKQSLPALHGFPELAARYDGPTLFLRGEKSGYVRDSHKAAIEHYFPKARIETVAGAAHWLHADKPDEVFSLVSGFLG